MPKEFKEEKKSSVLHWWLVSSSAVLSWFQIILLAQAQDQNAQYGVTFYFRNCFANDILMSIII